MDTPEPHDPTAPTLGAEFEAPSPPPAPPSSITPPLPKSPPVPPSSMTYPPTSPSSPSRTLRPEQQTSAVLDVQLDSEEEQPPEGGAQPRPRLQDAFANAQRREGRGSFMVEDSASPQGDHASLPSLTRTLSQEDVRHKPRPGIQPYGSMRAGTQTLIQALSAVPWTADASDDEGGGDLSRASTRSFKGKGKETPLGQGADVPTQPPPAPRRLASSLHTVYRPVALSQARSPSQSTIVQPPPPPHHHHHHRSHRSPETPSSPEISSIPMPPASLPSPLPASPPTRHRAPSSAASTHSHSSELHFPFKENTVARHAKPISSTETDYQLSALGRQEDASVTEDAVVRGEAGMSGSSSPSLEVREAGAGALRREKDRKASTETDAGLKRRKELAEMLREVFKLEEVEEVVGELACWLLRSVLLQGYMYLTTGHVCFYAHMPAKSENKVIKSGPLSKKSNRKIGSSTKYWFILKNAVLSWYVSSADPYFPHGNVDLQYAIDCEAVDEKTIKLTTNRRSYTFTSDTAASREEWVKAIRKVMFRTQHEGENVKIAIPLEAILDVETTSSLDFAETIEIKVVEGDETTLAFDSYFFAYFTNIDDAVVQIREVITTYRPQEQGSAPGWEKEQVYDTTMINRLGVRRGSSPSEGAIKPQMGAGSGISRIGSLLHPFSTGSSSTKSSPAESPRRSGEFGSGSGSAPIPISSRRSKDLERDSSSSSTAAPRLSTTPDSIRTVTPPPTSSSHTSYPPRSTTGPPPPGLELVHTSSTSSWAPSNFIRRPSMKIFASGASGAASSLLSSVRPASLIGKRRKNTPSSSIRKPVVEKVEKAMSTTDGLSDSTTDGWEGDGNGNGRASGSGGFSMMEKSETVDREEVEADREFHEWFAMGKKEVLLEHFAGFLFRVVPVSGKVFISTNHFCFKATALLYKTTMVIPIKDIIALQPQKAFRFGHHGLAVVIKGHEELFLEFSSSERRDACKSLLEQQMDQLRFKALHGPQPVSDQQQEALILQDLDTMGFSSPQRRKSTTNKHRHSRELSSTSGTGTDATGRSHSSPGSGYGSDHLPPVMFTSTESTFLDFKPKEPMHITCLTIGSRGDVQPYIALCKGLKAEGHSVRIASHGEYKDWIEGHGIEFGYVGGDPAELMRICIENGMFTVSFIKEGLNKFREWIDDLLVTSWDACQGTDLLIESPSAMGGVHIAEGLGIPYYRAFTMPWSRTRAYPHAFAVPDHHRGGSYNYMTYTMFDQVFWRAISGQINRWRKKVIGISSTNLDKLEPHKVPFLYNFSPTVVPPPLDWYEWIRITGYWFLDDPDDSANKKWSPPDGLLEFMAKAREDGKKIVYIGFGSIVVSDPDAMTACVVQSVLESDVRVILSKGWSDRLQTKKDVAPGEEAPAEETPEEKAEKEKLKIAREREMFPAEVFPIASVPHDWLFPRIDAACHHGGAGTTGASLRAGIPTIILPFFGDQYFWADRVEVLGVGSGMKKLTQDHLTAALKTATTDEKQIRKAKALGEEIRAENGVATAIEAIYRDLEYARSLIKHPHASSSSSSSSSAESSPTNSPISSPVRRTTPLPSHSRSESTTPPAPGSDESWDVVTGEDQRRSSEGGSGSGSGGGSSTRSSKAVSGGLGLVGSVVNGVVGGIGGKLGIGK